MKECQFCVWSGGKVGITARYVVRNRPPHDTGFDLELVLHRTSLAQGNSPHRPCETFVPSGWPTSRSSMLRAAPHILDIPSLTVVLCSSRPNCLFYRSSPFMSTISSMTSRSAPVICVENLHFDYPDADIILRSRDSHEFHVLKVYILHSSPILGEEVLISPNTLPSPSVILAESEVDGPTSADTLQTVEL